MLPLWGRGPNLLAAVVSDPLPALPFLSQAALSNHYLSFKIGVPRTKLHSAFPFSSQRIARWWCLTRQFVKNMHAGQANAAEHFYSGHDEEKFKKKLPQVLAATSLSFLHLIFLVFLIAGRAAKTNQTLTPPAFTSITLKAGAGTRTQNPLPCLILVLCFFANFKQGQ